MKHILKKNVIVLMAELPTAKYGHIETLANLDNSYLFIEKDTEEEYIVYDSEITIDCSRD